MNVITVGMDNVAKTGFFCKMSQKKSVGYQRKLKWLEERFAEGLTIKMLDLSEGGRGFIEYIPGEYAWRAVNAKDYLFIHCLWVVGSSKGKGYAHLLLDECIQDAGRLGFKGVAMLTSESNWLMGKQFLVEQGFDCVDQAQPSFSLMVKKFDGTAVSPSMPSDWAQRAQAFGPGLTVVRTDQCPYIDDAVNTVIESGAELGIPVNVVKFTSTRDVQERAPSPFGVFSILLDGKEISYYYQLKKDLVQLIKG